MANLLGYTANVGKSIAYAGANFIKEKTPNIADFKETNSELFRTSYTGITNYRQTYKKILDYTQKSQVYEAGVQLKKSLIEDLKSGNFYNTKRMDSVLEDESGFGGDFEGLSDFNFDDDDFGMGDDSGMDMGSAMISTSISAHSEANANAISNSVVNTGIYGAQVSRENTNLLYIQNANAYKGIHNGMNSINQNIGTLLPMVDMTSQILDNQKKYYEESTKLFQDQTALLREMNDNLKKLTPSGIPPIAISE